MRQEAREKRKKKKIICNEPSEQCLGCVTDSHKTTCSYPHSFCDSSSRVHAAMFLPRAQRHTSQEQLEPDLLSILQLMVTSTGGIMGP